MENGIYEGLSWQDSVKEKLPQERAILQQQRNAWDNPPPFLHHDRY
jgi:hypothetical protein